ncbi:MAG: hypothetical protein AAGC63_03890 [Propionicimonas sp.]
MTQPPPAPRSLPVLAGLSAIALVVAILVPWLGLLMAGPAAGVVPERPALAPAVFLLQAVSGTLLVYLVAATWFATPWFERRGVLPALAGLALYVVWDGVDDIVANWRTHPWVQVVPEALGLESYSALVANLGTALIAVILLVVGGALLLTRPQED